ncbi:MAG: GNAT family N-acetyltransferase [Actinobacteria bacterium]|nr:GNAT family N-acetyltransferase [Actinomycetota bacterium]MBM3713316.1 GNAT family N-acetyltransferase [Actinomycetota bacterium]
MEVKINSNLNIRKFSLEDLSKIMEIEHSSFTADTFSENTFLSLYRKCSELFIVAEIDKTIVGYMVTCNYWKRWRVISIAVDPVYRRKGIGSALANFTINQLKVCRIKNLELEVRVTNSGGIGFWKSLDFYSLKIIPYYYLDGTNAMVMRKLLK